MLTMSGSVSFNLNMADQSIDEAAPTGVGAGEKGPRGEVEGGHMTSGLALLIIIAYFSFLFLDV